MKKIMMITMLLVLLGCAPKENEAIKVYQNAFDATFQGSYTSLTTIEQDSNQYVTKTYSEIYNDESQKGSVSYSLNYEQNSLINGKITYLEGEDYVVYLCDGIEENFRYDSTSSALLPIKNAIVDPSISEVDKKKSEITNYGCVLYYKQGESYCLTEVYIKNGLIDEEITKCYEDSQYERVNYEMVVYYDTPENSLESELMKVKEFKTKGLQDVENIIEAK